MRSGRHVIMVVHVSERVKNAGSIQESLTKHGCYIKTRLGLHQASEDFCSPHGLIVLEMLDEPSQITSLETDLKAIPGIDVKTLYFG